MTHLSDLPIPTPTVSSLPRNLNFLSIWAAQVFSQIADKIYLVFTITLLSQKLSIHAPDISPWVTGIMVAFTVPAILFGSVAGVFVDRWSKKWVLIGSNLWRGGLVLFLPVALVWFPDTEKGYLALLGTTFLISTLTQFFTPAEQSAITLVVDRSQLLTANSVYASTVMAAMILGFAAGEPSLLLADRWLGALGKEILVGGCYLLAAGLLGILRTGETAENRQRHEFHVWRDLEEGVAHLQTQPIVQAALLQLVCTFSVIAALTVLAVKIAEIIPELAPEEFGYLLAVASIGIGVGAGIVGKTGDRISRQRWALVGTIGMTTFLVGLAFTTTQLLSALGMVAGIGVAAGLCVIPMQTVIQEETPEAVRGKVFGLQNNVVNVALSLPLALAGFAESYFGLTPVLLGLAAAVLLGGIGTAKIAATQKN